MEAKAGSIDIQRIFLNFLKISTKAYSWSGWQALNHEHHRIARILNGLNCFSVWGVLQIYSRHLKHRSNFISIRKAVEFTCIIQLWEQPESNELDQSQKKKKKKDLPIKSLLKNIFKENNIPPSRKANKTRILITIALVKYNYPKEVAWPMPEA